MTSPSTKLTTGSKFRNEGDGSVDAQPRALPNNTFKNAIFGILAALLMAFAFEGLCSILVAIRDVRGAPVVAERLHTRYDSELGWSNVPNSYIRDMYGASKDVRINSLGYRNNREFSRKVPAGKLRVLCSGDSFTFGYGVGNDETWGNALESRDSRLETVNMGEGGYGIDQMLLLYQRDINRLDANVHILAVIDDDFNRTLSDRFIGYGKPVLRLRGGKLVTANTPVPERPWQARLTLLSPHLDQVKSIVLVGELLHKFLPAAHLSDVGTPRNPTEDQRQALLQMFESFRDLDRSKDRVFVFVYLPSLGELYEPERPGSWHRWIEAEAAKRGIVSIDLLPDFVALPAPEIGGMYIQKNIGNYIGSRGHFTVAGNKFVAERIRSKLSSMPAFKSKLANISPE